MRWLRWIIGIAVTLVAADVFVRWFARLPYELEPVSNGLEALGRALGISDPENVEMLGIILLYAVAIAVIGTLVAACGTWISRWQHRPSGPTRSPPSTR